MGVVRSALLAWASVWTNRRLQWRARNMLSRDLRSSSCGDTTSMVESGIGCFETATTASSSQLENRLASQPVHSHGARRRQCRSQSLAGAVIELLIELNPNTKDRQWFNFVTLQRG